MNTPNLPVTLQIGRMTESNGNVTFYGFATRADVPKEKRSIMSHSSYQVYGGPLDHVWIEMWQFARWAGIPASEIKLPELTEQEQELLDKTKEIWYE